MARCDDLYDEANGPRPSRRTFRSEWDDPTFRSVWLRSFEDPPELPQEDPALPDHHEATVR